jgi:hypothetical protein
MTSDPYLVLSFDDVDVDIQRFMRAGYSEHRIFFHRGVKPRIHCQNNDKAAKIGSGMKYITGKLRNTGNTLISENRFPTPNLQSHKSKDR